MKKLIRLLILFGLPAFANPVSLTQTVRLTYSGTNVTTSAWVTLVSSLNLANSGYVTSGLQIFDSSGQTLELGVGSAGNEVVQFIIPPGGNGFIFPFYIPNGSRVSLKALSGTANAGEIDVNFFY